ncbi:hypothetical protein OsI_14843 [Oryza sativa Indica Group]|uniref:Uncharacterized protein n=1 Tax=Oryza sativa subsp. indica TaxID=39946 RepID=A2XQD4_ORYSI|nr:hypothetical protein OsI_14843 [Oryza sativa Indica Group]
MTLLYKLVWKPLTIDENAVMRISYKVMAVKARSRHDALVATAISYQRNFRRRSHTVLGEIWVPPYPLSIAQEARQCLCNLLLSCSDDDAANDRERISLPCHAGMPYRRRIC